MSYDCLEVVVSLHFEGLELVEGTVFETLGRVELAREAVLH